MAELQAQHHSKVGTMPKPRNMEIARMSPDTRRFIENEALSIFTDMSNQGASLQQTLAAIFLSGMNAATEARR